MPKYSKAENRFWTTMLHYANGDIKTLKCNICNKHIKARSKSAHDHFFYKAHPQHNIYEVFADTPIDSRTLLRVNGVEQRI